MDIWAASRSSDPLRSRLHGDDRRVGCVFCARRAPEALSLTVARFVIGVLAFGRELVTQPRPLRQRSVRLRIFSEVYLCSRSLVSRMNSAVSRNGSRCGSIRKNGQQAKPVSTLRSNHAMALSVSPSTAYAQAIW